MSAAKHPHESARLVALRHYDILDSPDEAAFDDIVRLVAHICQAPIAVINLIDSDRQWFKSEIGLGVRETPLDISLCAHAILEREYMEIPDTTSDPRFSENPLVVGDPNLRFYAGALLQSSDGLPIGTLCVLDYKTRELDNSQRDALRILGRQVMAQMELRLRLSEVKSLNDALRRSMVESHHRIKNNLQMLSGMVEMQIQDSGESVPAADVRLLGQRIRALATLHDLLTSVSRDSDASPSAPISARDALGRLTAVLSITTGNRPLRSQIAPILLSLKQTTALVVLAQELVANAVKHGAGPIALSLDRENDSIRLRVRDHGAGFPENFTPDSGHTGAELIESLARWDLGGDVRYENHPDGGAQVSITFPAEAHPT